MCKNHAPVLVCSNGKKCHCDKQAFRNTSDKVLRDLRPAFWVKVDENGTPDNKLTPICIFCLMALPSEEQKMYVPWSEAGRRKLYTLMQKARSDRDTLVTKINGSGSDEAPRREERVAAVS